MLNIGYILILLSNFLIFWNFSSLFDNLCLLYFCIECKNEEKRVELGDQIVCAKKDQMRKMKIFNGQFLNIFDAVNQKSWGGSHEIYDKCYFCLDQLPKLKKRIHSKLFGKFWEEPGYKRADQTYCTDQRLEFKSQFFATFPYNFKC